MVACHRAEERVRAVQDAALGQLLLHDHARYLIFGFRDGIAVKDLNCSQQQ
jgi:hypothetical protein